MERTDLKKIAEEIRASGNGFAYEINKRDLTPGQKTRLKEYLGLPVKTLQRAKIISETKDDFEELLRAHEEALKLKPPKPIKRVTIKGKRYIDITADIVDCGD